MQKTTTFSMILAHLISERCQADKIPMQTLFSKVNLSQPTWWRITRGQTKFDIETLRLIERNFGYSMEWLIVSAKEIEARAKQQDIEVIQPFAAVSKEQLETAGKVIVAGAIIAFLASQVLKK